ncbi:MAG: hypothetical protein AAGF11_48345 [Myxococcota bacterium]
MSLTIAIVLAALSPAGADPPASAPASAPQHDPAARAGALFRDGRFAEAAAAFQDAYQSTGDPAFLFGRAQALRRAGNCGAAIEVFEAFIAASPPAPDVEAAQEVIEACRSILGESASEPSPTSPPETTPADPAVAPERPRWPRDVIGGVLLGTGAAVTIVGAALYGTAAARRSDRPETEQGYEDRQRQVLTLGSIGIGAMITGGALLVGSVVRYVLVARSEGALRGPQARRSTPRGGRLRVTRRPWWRRVVVPR